MDTAELVARDGWLIFALGVIVGGIAGWIGHAVYVELWAVAKYLLQLLRKVHGWRRARDARRLADLEAKMAELFPTLQ